MSRKFNLSLRGRGEETLFSFPPQRENGTKNSPRMQKTPNMGMTPQMKPTPKMNTTQKIMTRSEIKINPKNNDNSKACVNIHPCCLPGTCLIEKRRNCDQMWSINV